MPRFLFDIDERAWGGDEITDPRNDARLMLPREVIAGVLLEGGRMAIVGPPKAQKTQEALYLALMLATGGEWRGHRCERSRVLYMSVELTLAEMAHRLRVMVEWYELDPHDLKNLKIVSLVGVTIEDVDVDDLYDAVMTPQERDRQIDEADRMDGAVPTIRAIVDSVNASSPFLDDRDSPIGADVLVIDPLQKVLGTDETDARGVNGSLLCLDGLESWRDGGPQPKMTCVYVHHTPKGGGAGSSPFDALRGSGALGADASAVVQLAPLHVPKGSPAWDEMERAGVPDPSTGAYEMRFGLRAFPSPPPVRLMATWPVSSPLESDSPLQGSHTLAARGGEARAARAAEDRERRARATRAAMEACEAEGVEPTGQNVLERVAGPCEAEGIAPPRSRRTMQRWVKECQDPSL